MAKQVSIAANGDYDLALGVRGLMTIIADPMGAATVELRGEMTGSGAASVSARMQNGTFTQATLDALNGGSFNVYASFDRVFARVTGYSAPFALWCSS